jgi:hypothetical protein
VLHRARHLVSSYYRLSHGWHLSNDGYAVPPLPEWGASHPHRGVQGAAFAVAAERPDMGPEQPGVYGRLPARVGWGYRSLDSGWSNCTARRVWWHRRDID